MRWSTCKQGVYGIVPPRSRSTTTMRPLAMAVIMPGTANLERDRRICEIRMADYLLESDILKQQGGVPPPGPLPDVGDKDT